MAAAGERSIRTLLTAWREIAQHTHLAQPGSLADWLEWLRSMGRYDSNRMSALEKKFVGSYWMCNGGKVTQTPRFSTEWKCLLETMDPRGPKRASNGADQAGRKRKEA